MNGGDLIRQALDQLWLHRLRTALTLLGMIFGVGAVIAMLAVGEGGRREALTLIDGLGLRNLIVHDRPAEAEALRDLRTRSAGLSLRDLEAARESFPMVEAASALKEVRVWELFSEQGDSDARVFGVSPEHFDLAHLEIRAGRRFGDAEERAAAPVAVLGSEAARALFPNGGALHGRVKINHVWVEVIGILADRSLARNEFQGQRIGGEANHVYLPLATAQKRFAHPLLASEIDGFRLRVAADQPVAPLAEPLAELLARRHGGERDFEVVVPARLLAQQEQTQRIFTVVLASIAGISLLVGGIGIMNIMLASVLERRAEIGLLRALGARRKDIVRQFLTETTVVAALGALLGIVFGIALAYAIGAFAGWPVAWSPLTILLAVSVCVGIAVAFGVYPAREAARLDPVKALQSE